MQKWGKLTDDDLTAIEGSTTKLVGILQKKYGYDKIKAEIQRLYGASQKSGMSPSLGLTK